MKERPGRSAEIGNPAPSARRVRRKGALAPDGIPMIRVLVADDQALVRAGSGRCWTRGQDIEVVGEAADGRRR